MRAGLILGALLAAGSAAAQDVPTGRDAARMLFGQGTEVVLFPMAAITDDQFAAIRAQGAQGKYYGAAAASPDEGISLARPSFAMVFNFHDLVAAETIALRACNNARARGSAPCAVVAHIRPEGYAPRDVQLNADATRGFRVYRQGGGPKALAISRATGEWHFEKGEGAEAAALAGCNRLAARKGAEDCQILVSDP